jgi:hypothetical protein
MRDGLLEIDLKLELPDALKPRRIEINAPRAPTLQHREKSAA